MSRCSRVGMKGRDDVPALHAVHAHLQRPALHGAPASLDEGHKLIASFVGKGSLLKQRLVHKDQAVHVKSALSRTCSSCDLGPRTLTQARFAPELLAAGSCEGSRSPREPWRGLLTMGSLWG